MATLEKDRSNDGDQTKFWQVPELGNLEVLHATYRRHAFERHAHEGYATGIIDCGAGSFWYRGTTRAVPAGSLTALDAGEAHTGQVVSGKGWSYRILYPSKALLENIAEEAFGWRGEMHFPEPVFHDAPLAASMDNLHRSLEELASTLERESLLLSTYASLLARHAEQRRTPECRPASGEPRAVSRAREYLDECFAEDVSLRKLAEVVGLSRYHLIRTFRENVGLPPHAYLTQVRLRRARKQLAVGEPIAAVAQGVGFVDQSHLTRRFKGAFGITPGQFLRRFAAPAS